MRWYKRLFVGDSIKGKRFYYQYLIAHTQRMTGTYSLMIAENGHDLLEICRSERLRNMKMYPKEQMVIGLAGDKAEAMNLAGKIILHVYKKTGGTDVRSYFNQ